MAVSFSIASGTSNSTQNRINALGENNVTQYTLDSLSYSLPSYLVMVEEMQGDGVVTYMGVVDSIESFVTYRFVSEEIPTQDFSYDIFMLVYKIKHANNNFNWEFCNEEKQNIVRYTYEFVSENEILYISGYLTDFDDRWVCAKITDRGIRSKPTENFTLTRLTGSLCRREGSA